MRLALATRSDLPSWEVDDRHLQAALAARGVSFAQPVWDDPGVDWAAFDAVLIRTTWDYQEKLPAFLRWAERTAAVVARFDNPATVVRWNTHKRYLRDLQRHGVPIVPTSWLERGSQVDLGARLAGLGAAEGFLKPCIGSTARETLRFAADRQGLAAAQAHLDRLLPHEDLMLQPFLRAVTERGEWSAVFVAGRITHCVRKIPVPGDYRVQDDFGARDEPYVPTVAERSAAVHAVAAAQRQLGLDDLLYARADFLWTDADEPVLTELELVEPSLFFRHGPQAAVALADAWLARIGG
ncbi:MAG: hypothetical protein KF830_14095 [Planctomycetes bacterium]|nr:hypothetical protein [Planctomycetota bacterium]